MGLYLGTASRHKISVSLILYLETSIVSPQFHVQQYDIFDILHPTADNTLNLSHWRKCLVLQETRHIKYNHKTQDQV